MILEKMPDVKQLSSADKLCLVTELWDDLAANPASVPVCEAYLDELDRRLEHYKIHPEESVFWADVKTRLSRNG